MAVYTEVREDELARFVVDYDIGEVLACKGIAEGVENSNFFLQTTKGPYFLTLYEKRVQPEDLPFFISLMEHLAANGITCPRPVHGRDGEALRQLAGRPAAIITFLNGVSPRRPEPRHCAEIGRGLAALHLGGLRFTMHRPNTLSVDGWRRLLSSCDGQGESVRKGLTDELEKEWAYLQAHWPQELPKGIIHADLFPDNALFLDGRLSGIIDFYFACNDFLAYDLAITMNAWCFEADGAFNVTKARSLLDAYQKVRVLSAAEIAALPILCRGAALRFLLTRLYDWLNRQPGALVRPKDPLECWRQLNFHRQAESAAAYGIT